MLLEDLPNFCQFLSLSCQHFGGFWPPKQTRKLPKTDSPQSAADEPRSVAQEEHKRRTRKAQETHTIRQKYDDKFLYDAAHKCNLTFDAQCTRSSAPNDCFAAQAPWLDSNTKHWLRQLQEWAAFCLLIMFIHEKMINFTCSLSAVQRHKA